MSEATPIITEIELEPTYSKGELVPDKWWEPPHPKQVSLFQRHWLFGVVVGLPLFVATIYLGLIAADQFTSEARFIVRTSAQAGVGNLASLMQGQKLSRATDETYAVSDYLTSRDAMRALLQYHHLRDIFSRPQADFLNRFPNAFSRDNDEELYRHFQYFISVNTESESGISTLRVRAFTPGDARDIATALLQNGESLVNRLNSRAYADALRFATQLVEEQKAKVLEIEDQLTKFRNEQRVIDPNKESAAALENVGKMMSDLMALEAGLNEQIAVAADSPSIPPLLEKIHSYGDEIAKQRAQIAGDNASLAGKLAAFDNLILDRELAAKGLEAAVVHLIGARQDAEHQQLYLQTIVEPDLADESLYPKRVLTLLAVLGLSLCVYWIAKAFIESVLEHEA